MKKPEMLKLKRILMINAFVKFNLIPPVDSEEWNANATRYKMMPTGLIPISHMTEDDSNEKKMMQLLGMASAAKTPHQKLNLYRQLTDVTGYTIEELADPALLKFNTLTGIITYSLFKQPSLDISISKAVESVIDECSRFYDTTPEYYFWDSHKYTPPPYTESLMAAEFCLQLKSAPKEDTELSCLYGLAILLNRKDIVALFQNEKVTLDNLPANSKLMLKAFLSYNTNNLAM